jgi:hypothetical protein
VLGLRVDAHAGALGEVDDLLEGRDELGAVEDGVGRPHVGQALLGSQRAQLGQGEVLGEPAGDRRAVHGLGGAAVGEGVLRPVAGAAAVTDHQREPLAHVLAGRGLAAGCAARDARTRKQGEQRRGERRAGS